MSEKGKGELPMQASCPGQIQVPTEKELLALNSLRKIKEKVKQKKKELAALKAPEDQERIKALEAELADLKAQWEDWEKKKEEAARERMILLGHEKAEC